MKPSTRARTHGVSFRRMLLRTALLLGSSAAFWLLTAAPASALDAAPVEDALETGVATVEDAAVQASHAAEAVVDAVDRAAPARDVARTVVGVVHATTAAVADVATGATAAPNEAADAVLDERERGDGARDDGRVVRRAGPARSVRRTTAIVDTAPTNVVTSLADEARPRVLLTAGERHPRAAGGSMPAPCLARDTRPTSAGFDDLSGLLASLTIVLGSGRWSRSAAEVRITPAFLSLTERPG